jgi:cytochrome c553
LRTAQRALRAEEQRVPQALQRFAQAMHSQARSFAAYSPRSERSPIMKLTVKHILLGAPMLVGAVLLAAPVAENWENHCAKCHGADGKGQTKTGKKLNVKDYTDAKVQAELKDDQMIKATGDGVVDKNGKERMKGYKDELSAEEIKDLVAYIRKFKA